ncbi:glycosyltransferase [Alteromonas mediterranea MED64]|uniref:glycosyltransferase n=1 Tax=Alteromonas mediterranea TaxID=314275 RepID=UPI0003557EC7|nr:glycosyltransferase [Alteromonas mediterranea]AGP82631.1 glycosyltransferase [Alteromonas mediterranea MED64]MBR9784367.1 glycosyltransferase [Gammaproteobacteria bacterium]
MTKTIFHVVYGLHVGGLERVLVNTVSRMPKNYAHTVICLTSYSDSFVSLLPSNTNVIALGKKEGQDFGLFFKWWKLLRAYQPDVVHSYNLATLELQVISALAGVRVRLHAEHGRDVYDPFGDNKKYQLLRRLVSPFIHTWVSVSTELHMWLKNTVGLSTSKTQLIRNGIDTNLFTPQHKSSDEFIVGHVGRLNPIKNQILLIDAFCLASCRNTEFAKKASLRIVGEGESELTLRDHIVSKNMSKKISLIGLREDMPGVYGSFSVFVMSSIGEGIPMTLLEAMASGVPAIVTDVGGMPEVVTRKEGIVVPSQDADALADALILLFDSPDLLHSFANASRERICKDFDEDKMVSDYLSLYNQ